MVRAVRLQLLPLVVLGSLVATVACTQDADLVFVDDLRNAYPDLAVADVSDDELVGLGLASCDDGLDEDERERLDELGIATEDFARLALPLCPSR